MQSEVRLLRSASQCGRNEKKLPSKWEHHQADSDTEEQFYDLDFITNTEVDIHDTDRSSVRNTVPGRLLNRGEGKVRAEETQ